jgi:hypothetical protein
MVTKAEVVNLVGRLDDFFADVASFTSLDGVTWAR